MYAKQNSKNNKIGRLMKKFLFLGALVLCGLVAVFLNGINDVKAADLDTNSSSKLIAAMTETPVDSKSSAIVVDVSFAERKGDNKIAVIKAEDLAENKNPKFAGILNEGLKVSLIKLIERGDIKTLLLSGNALPNTTVAIYIFSDPIIITVKTDASGYWSYELSREFADGNHEAYVAILDEEGGVVSKSAPVAFIKTAQAASIVPMSEIENNQSPLIKLKQQYMMMAVVIIAVCLILALSLISFFAYKKQ